MKETKDELKKRLTPIQFSVTQDNDTERPFTGAYWDSFNKGLYIDIVSGVPLFLSKDKFESSCGWPSFTKPIDDDRLVEKKDFTFGMIRIEVRGKESDAHLGHVFDDGPIEFGGLRYCINSASLDFIPYDELEERGYGEYLSYFEEEA